MSGVEGLRNLLLGPLPSSPSPSLSRIGCEDKFFLQDFIIEEKDEDIEDSFSHQDFTRPKEGRFPVVTTLQDTGVHHSIGSSS